MRIPSRCEEGRDRGKIRKTLSECRESDGAFAEVLLDVFGSQCATEVDYVRKMAGAVLLMEKLQELTYIRKAIVNLNNTIVQFLTAMSRAR